jgi:putative oxidoreductase
MPAGSAVAVATRSSGRWVKALSWGCRLIAAVILLQTLFFKFTAAPESVYIFTKLGVFLNHYIPFLSVDGIQVYTRIGSGIMELIAAALILIPRTVWTGAVLAMAATGGAILSHLTFLGLVVMEDGGLLFGLALIVFATSAVSIFLHRSQIPVLGRRS